MFTIASASGNVFAFLWEDGVPENFDGSAWARQICPRDGGLGLDGLFLLRRPQDGQPWIMEHWDTDGSYTFCSNGSRAAAALEGAPCGDLMEVQSSGERILLNRTGTEIGIRMPEGPSFGLEASPLVLGQPSIFGWIGNPQLVVEVPSVDAIDLEAFARPLRHASAFPEGVNVNILEILSPGQARIRSWERGVEGETLSCGTGNAVAGAWLAQRTGLNQWTLQGAGKDPVTVSTRMGPGGRWQDLWLSGLVRVLGEFRPLMTNFWN